MLSKTLSKLQVKRALSTSFTVLGLGDVEFSSPTPHSSGDWYLNISGGLIYLYRFFPHVVSVNIRPHDPLLIRAFAYARTREQVKRILKHLFLTDFEIDANKTPNFSKIKSILGPLQFLFRSLKHMKKGPP